MIRKNKKIENKAVIVLILGVLAGIAILGGVFFLAKTAINQILQGLISFLDIVLGITTFFFNLLAQIAAILINVFIILNPFSNITIAPLLWEFFKNISYVILIFLSLWAGFQFILNREDEARRLLIGILIIAFLINFTYVLAEEFFNFFWYLTKVVLDIVGDVVEDSSTSITTSNFGEIIYTSLSFLFGEKAKDIGEKIINESLEQALAGGANSESIPTLNLYVLLGFKLYLLTMAFVGSAIMFIFAGIAFGKFFIISFLVGTLPLVCIAYLLPKQKHRFDQWWQLFFTWNINLLVLIILVMIGIFLFASTNSSQNIENIFSANLNNPNSIFNILYSNELLQKNVQFVTLLITLLMRFFIIIVYYLIVIYLALKMGSRFAESGYNFAKWSWTKTGENLASSAKFLTRTPLYKTGNWLEKQANVLATKGRFWGPLVANRLRNVARSLQEGVKKPSKEIAESIWEAIKNKSPEEIAKEANRLKGADLIALAEVIHKNKSPDEILKIFLESKNLQENEAARTKLCEKKLNCALNSIVKKDEKSLKEAAEKLGKSLDFDKIKAEYLIESLKTKLGISDDTTLQNFINTLLAQMDNKKKNRFFSNPANLAYLANMGLGFILTANGDFIRKTPAFRMISDNINFVLDNLGIKDENDRKKLANSLLEKYIKGELTDTKGKIKEEILKGEINKLIEDAKEMLMEQYRKQDEERQVYIVGGKPIEVQVKEKIQDIAPIIDDTINRLSQIFNNMFAI